MTSLIARLEALTEPDRELDAEIATDVLGFKGRREFGMGGNWWTRYTDGGLSVPVPHYTSSIDAAVVLARRLWPDMMYRIGNDGAGSDPSLFLGEVFIHGKYYTGISSVEAIALCIAILKAKEASHDQA